MAKALAASTPEDVAVFRDFAASQQLTDQRFTQLLNWLGAE